ncbi:DUF1761 domain-containing protein [Candidatus Bipolaricaulota bacterium]|nr:DUF1761 domain-containing protein [Candidatus Bipolaricaulota bacterium]TFH09809.1 MAG: DUF1761 domain-containing protein [Candidatus Atribacteria bacterium]
MNLVGSCACASVRQAQGGQNGVLGQFNWIAVLVGGIFNMALGSLWYGPLFGKVWLKAIGKTKDEIQSSIGMYILPLVAGLTSVYALAALISGLHITIWWQGALFGAIAYVGIGATATLIVGTFEASSRDAWLLYTIYQVIVFSAQGVMFVLWK